MPTRSIQHVPSPSLIEDGPGAALLKRLRLMRPEIGAASARTALILSVITWPPLLVLGMVDGVFWLFEATEGDGLKPGQPRCVDCLARAACPSVVTCC